LFALLLIVASVARWERTSTPDRGAMFQYVALTLALPRWSA
jgi:hypothetical protein